MKGDTVPGGMKERDAIVLDPMLATGNSAVAAVERLKETRPRSIRFVCLVSCPEGIATFQAAHPDVPWAAISGMRNRIYHDYGALDVSVLAETVRKDLPGLARQLEAIVEAP